MSQSIRLSNSNRILKKQSSKIEFLYDKPYRNYKLLKPIYVNRMRKKYGYEFYTTDKNI